MVMNTYKGIIMKKVGLFLLIASLGLTFSCTKTEDTPANQVLNRVIGDDASRFVFSLVEGDESNEWFEVEVKANKVYVKGNSSVALCKGAYHFIQENNYGMFSWEGTNVKIPSDLGEDRSYERSSSDLPYRMYINPCTYGYTMAWWTWERWEKEIDWMAMHGINMPIALLGQEIIWQEVWNEMGITDSNLLDYTCGPAFLPWFRMGNLYAHHGPLPQNWMDREKELQTKIVNRMRELDMQPVLPAFSGHVPNHFKELYPNAQLTELKNWGGLPEEKASLFLDPKDPLFNKIGKSFLEKYKEVYGGSSLYLADPFNEMYPPVSQENKNEELAEYGEAIYQGLKEFDPDATWVIQGWTFGHQATFWTPDATKSFFSRIPTDNLMILNYAEDCHALWKKLDSFYGFKWTYGYVHNYGGQQSLFGDVNFYHDEYENLINSPKKKNLVGYGSLPEAIENNSLVYEYIFDVPWGGTKKTVDQWMESYIANRYGVQSEKLTKAWKIAVDNTYAIKDWRRQNGYLGYGTFAHNNRPALKVKTGDYIGNPESLPSVLNLLVGVYESNTESDLLYYDIIDFSQHYTACMADIHLNKAIKAYIESDYQIGDNEFYKTKDFLLKLELLQVETGGSFTKWCNHAISRATNFEERELYLRNAKAQVSVWGGNRLKDYASKSWSGILPDFYIPRWQMLFDEVKTKGDAFDYELCKQKIIAWEMQWIENGNVPASPETLSRAEYVSLIKEMIK